MYAYERNRNDSSSASYAPGKDYSLEPFILLTAAALLPLLFLAFTLTCLSLLLPVSSLIAPVFLSLSNPDLSFFFANRRACRSESELL